MERTCVQKLAGVLRVLVTAVFVCNLLVLPLVPVLAAARGAGIAMPELLSSLTVSAAQKEGDLLTFSPGVLLCLAVIGGWAEHFSYTLALTLFLLFCGVCTAVILWQAGGVLSTVRRQMPFCMENASSMRRAAVCCFLISSAALGRTCWGLWFYRSAWPLLTYNALFCPLFLLAGLLGMVMSALFRQAAELKADSDLTI